MSERTWFVTRLLWIQSLFFMAIGLTWLFTATTGRLAGVYWLQYAIPFTGVDPDTIMGLGWVLTAVLMAVLGWLGQRRKWAENAGYSIGLFWPVLAGAIFFVAFLQGVAPNGWITTISYTALTAPSLALLLKYDGAREVTLATGTIELPVSRGDEEYGQ